MKRNSGTRPSNSAAKTAIVALDDISEEQHIQFTTIVSFAYIHWCRNCFNVHSKSFTYAALLLLGNKCIVLHYILYQDDRKCPQKPAELYLPVLQPVLNVFTVILLHVVSFSQCALIAATCQTVPTPFPEWSMSIMIFAFPDISRKPCKQDLFSLSHQPWPACIV